MLGDLDLHANSKITKYRSASIKVIEDSGGPSPGLLNKIS